MYSEAFCKVYNEFGWNYFPLAFGEQLMVWLERAGADIKESMDLACGPGVLCEFLKAQGIHSAGMDFSEGMIQIAKERDPSIPYEVADMITYCPDKKFDLVTCTGDAMNHITDLRNVEKIFQNVHKYLSDTGYYIFDILDNSEIALDAPIDLDWEDGVTCQFMITQDEDGLINLKSTVSQNGEFLFEENITEIVHDPYTICELLKRNGFHIISCDRQLLHDQPAKGMKWFVICEKQK